jgi:DNA-binding CsgD family transcriptional regulator
MYNFTQVINRLKLSKLNKREVEVGILILKGLTNKELADRLFINEGTIKFHISNILKKAACKSRHKFMAKFLGTAEILKTNLVIGEMNT